MTEDMKGINDQFVLKCPLSPETFSNITNDISRPKYDVSNNEKMVFTIFSDTPNVKMFLMEQITITKKTKKKKKKKK